MSTSAPGVVSSLHRDELGNDSGMAPEEAPMRYRWAKRLSAGRSPDLIAGGIYLLGALFVTARLWRRPERMVAEWHDEVLLEWMMAHAARAVTHLENPLFSTRINVPDGVNLMANVSVLGLGVPLTPVTLVFGPHVTFLLALVLSFAGSAFAWYLLLSRTVVASRFAAALGGLFCGFAPGMVSQATGHLHIVAQFVLPAIIYVLIRAREGAVLRGGIALGLLVTYQVFVGEELLLFLALAFGLFAVAYACFDWSDARQRLKPLLGVLGIGGGIAVVLLAYPLWFQFFGPGHYHGVPFEPGDFKMDVYSYGTYAQQSLMGFDDVTVRLAPNPTEESAFFGVGLLVVCATIAVWFWRMPAVRALTICAVVFGLLSLGSTINVNGVSTGIPGPYRLLSDIPILNLFVSGRLAMVLVPIFAILLALATNRIISGPVSPGAPVRLIWFGTLVAVLLPLAPLPLVTYAVPQIPAFITGGQWRPYVEGGRTVVPVPPTEHAQAINGMYWSSRTELEFPIPGGRFNGPSSPTDATVRGGPVHRPTALLLAKVSADGRVPVITDSDRRQAIADLEYWRAGVVVLGDVRFREPLRQAVEELLGPGQLISGAWVWDARALTGP